MGDKNAVDVFLAQGAGLSTSIVPAVRTVCANNVFERIKYLAFGDLFCHGF